MVSPASAGQHVNPPPPPPAHAVQGHVVQPTAGMYARQRPLLQTSSLPQTLPHAPQLRPSVRVFTQPPAHNVVPPVHVPAAQAAGFPLQIVPAPHAVPHAPQLAADTRLTHLPPHEPSPGLQTQLPDAQYSPSAHA